MDALSQLFCLLGLALPVQSEIAPPALGREGVVLVAAHRGGYSNDKVDNAPENSVANVKLAIRKGFDVFETDIQRTADGVFVIVHDSTLDRETNGSGPVKNLTLKQLKALRKRYRDGSLSEERVATLEELLLAGRGKILFKPDLKPGIIDHFTELAQLITRLKMADQVFLRTGFGDAWEIKSCFENGCPRVEVMFKTKSLAQVKSVIERFSRGRFRSTSQKEKWCLPTKRMPYEKPSGAVWLYKRIAMATQNNGSSSRSLVCECFTRELRKRRCSS